MLRRRVDFERAEPGPEEPVLVIGAVDVLLGEFRAFDSRRDRISADTVLASAAIPTLFRAVSVDGGTFWDEPCPEGRVEGPVMSMISSTSTCRAPSST